MSRAEEKQIPLTQLDERLRLLGLTDEPAAKNMLRDLRPANIPGAVVESVDQLLALALDKQKEKFKTALRSLIEQLH